MYFYEVSYSTFYELFNRGYNCITEEVESENVLQFNDEYEINIMDYKTLNTIQKKWDKIKDTNISENNDQHPLFKKACILIIL